DVETTAVRWLLATIMATVPISIIALAKYGGSYNSFIPALVSLAAFCAWRFRTTCQLLSQPDRSLPVRNRVGLIFGSCFLASGHPQDEFLTAVKGNFHRCDRTKVIPKIRSIPGYYADKAIPDPGEVPAWTGIPELRLIPNYKIGRRTAYQPFKASM